MSLGTGIGRAIFRFIFSLIVLGALCAQPIQGAPFYEVKGSVDQLFGPPNFNRNFGTFNQNSPTGTFNSLHFTAGSNNPPGFNEEMNAYASAMPGEARVYADARYFRAGPVDITADRFVKVSGSAQATAFIDDVVINGPPGPVNASLNLHLSGTLAAGSDASFGSNSTSGGSSVAINMLINGVNVGQGYLERLSVGGGAPHDSSTGLLNGFSGSATITGSPKQVQANIPFSVWFILSGDALAAMNDDNRGTGSGAMLFDNTLSFPTDGPVFNLPAGYTAMSVQGSIVNNQYAPVPEPGAFWALLGLGMLVRGRRGL